MRMWGPGGECFTVGLGDRLWTRRNFILPKQQDRESGTFRFDVTTWTPQARHGTGWMSSGCNRSYLRLEGNGHFVHLSAIEKMLWVDSGTCKRSRSRTDSFTRNSHRGNLFLIVAFQLQCHSIAVSFFLPILLCGVLLTAFRLVVDFDQSGR